MLKTAPPVGSSLETHWLSLTDHLPPINAPNTASTAAKPPGKVQQTGSRQSRRGREKCSDVVVVNNVLQ